MTYKLPVGDRFKDVSKFREIGQGGGDTLYECWGSAVQAAYEAGQKSQVRISIPTDGMEQEFQNHHRIGYKAGQRSAFERCVKICDLAARSIEAARAHADGSLGGANPQYFHPILKTISDITNKIRAEIDSQT